MPQSPTEQKPKQKTEEQEWQELKDYVATTKVVPAGTVQQLRDYLTSPEPSMLGDYQFSDFAALLQKTAVSIELRTTIEVALVNKYIALPDAEKNIFKKTGREKLEYIPRNNIGHQIAFLLTAVTSPLRIKWEINLSANRPDIDSATIAEKHMRAALNALKKIRDEYNTANAVRNPAGFISTAIGNAMLDLTRKKRPPIWDPADTEDAVPVFDKTLRNIHDRSPGPEERFLQQDREAETVSLQNKISERLSAALSGLTPIQRKIYDLWADGIKRGEKVSHRTIATQLGIPELTVKNSLFRIRRLLRSVLETEAGATDASLPPRSIKPQKRASSFAAQIASKQSGEEASIGL